jgi:PAS domain S-box-containing protein
VLQQLRSLFQRKADPPELEYRRQLKELTDAIPSILAIIDRQHRYEIANRRYEEYFGLKVEEYSGMPVEKVLGSEGYTIVKGHLDPTLAGETVHFETYLTYPAAGRRYISADLMPRRSANGDITGIFVHVSDITERKQTEERLQQSERDLEQIFAQSPAFMCFLTGPDYRFSRANQKYFELLGLDSSILGRRVLEVLPEAEAQGFIELLDGVFRSGIPFIGNEALFKLNTPNGVKEEYIDFVYQAVRDNSGRITGVIAQGYVVTEKVRAVQAIARAKLAVENERENFRNLFRQTPEMVCILRGPEHTFEFVNDAHVRALGFDATGMTVRQAQPESTEVYGLLDGVYQTGKTAELHEIPVTLTDRVRYFNLTYAARRDPNGVIDGVMILGVEVTDQVLNRSALQKAIQARDEFMSIASHELKTPLTSLQLQSQLRQKIVTRPGPLNQEKLAQMFETDVRHIRRITRLIDDMLDVSRIAAGKFVLNRESFDLSELTQDLLQRFGPQIEASGCELIIQADEPVMGSWDRFRLEQVVTNLLTNAMKYGAGKPITVSVRHEGGMARLTVQDQGMGVAPENQHRIFDRFERAVAANDISGLGLGLYISRQIVDLHHGRIGLESELGKGSTFFVELPLT